MVDTAVAAFIGVSSTGPDDPVELTSWAEFTPLFGPAVSGGYLADAVHGFFRNGGRRAHVVRTAGGIDLDRALAALDGIAAVTIVTAPDVWAAAAVAGPNSTGPEPNRPDELRAQQALIAHCERHGDRLAILDAPPGLTARAALHWRSEVAGYDSMFAALYYPWLKVFDPVLGAAKLIPSSGHLAGVWARADAPRGLPTITTNDVVHGVIGVGAAISRTEHERLDSSGVNCVRAFTGRGVRVWGGRTLSADPRWRDISVRRLVSHIESSVRRSTDWLAVAPNDARIREQLVRTVRAYLFEVWVAGGLVGETVDQAFYVRSLGTDGVDAEDGTAELGCEVGIATTTPGSFVSFGLSQRREIDPAEH